MSSLGDVRNNLRQLQTALGELAQREAEKLKVLSDPENLERLKKILETYNGNDRRTN